MLLVCRGVGIRRQHLTQQKQKCRGVGGGDLPLDRGGLARPSPNLYIAKFCRCMLMCVHCAFAISCSCADLTFAMSSCHSRVVVLCEGSCVHDLLARLLCEGLCLSSPCLHFSFTFGLDIYSRCSTRCNH